MTSTRRYAVATRPSERLLGRSGSGNGSDLPQLAGDRSPVLSEYALALLNKPAPTAQLLPTGSPLRSVYILDGQTTWRRRPVPPPPPQPVALPASLARRRLLLDKYVAAPAWRADDQSTVFTAVAHGDDAADCNAAAKGTSAATTATTHTCHAGGLADWRANFDTIAAAGGGESTRTASDHGDKAALLQCRGRRSARCIAGGKEGKWKRVPADNAERRSETGNTCVDEHAAAWETVTRVSSSGSAPDSTHSAKDNGGTDTTMHFYGPVGLVTTRRRCQPRATPTVHGCWSHSALAPLAAEPVVFACGWPTVAVALAAICVLSVACMHLMCTHGVRA